MVLYCEICGARIEGAAYRVRVDRAEVIACPRCARRYGRLVGSVSPKSQNRQSVPKRVRPRRRRPEVYEEVVEDFAERIREARERMGLSRDVLAAMVGEKVSTIRRIEDGTLMPPIPLARKLERVLKIKLVELVEEGDYEYEEPSESFELTLGDIVEIKEG